MTATTSASTANAERPVPTPANDGVVRVPYIRSAVDGIRASAGLALVVLGFALTSVFDSTMAGFASDTASAGERLPGWSRDLAGTLLASVVIVGTAAVALRSLVTTRYRRFAVYAVGIATAAGISIALGRVAYDMVDASVQRSLSIDVPLFRVSVADGRLNPADPLLASAIATVTIAASYISTQIVRRALALVAAYVLVSVVAVPTPPLALFADVGAGVLIGSLLLLVFGRHDVALRHDEIRSALSDAGCETVRLEAANVDGVHDIATGARWFAHGSNGERLLVVASSRDDRSSALITRLVRWVRFRKTGDHRPFLTLRRSVEHEALVALQVGSAGIDTPTIRAVVPAGVDGMVLARDEVDGERTRQPDCEPVPSPLVLRSIWQQADRLHMSRIAHGHLRLTSFVLDHEGRPWLTGFGHGELAAPEQRLGTDLAELLASTAAAVGIADAVRLAHETVGSATLRRAIPWLQPLALTAATRVSIGGSEEIDRLREETASACGIEAEEPVNLERVDTKTLFVLGTIVLSAWFLLPQLADLDSLVSQVRGASWGWALVAAVLSVGTYVAATASLLGAIPVRLAFLPALTAQVASSFANRVTPAKVGGFATNLRYFQRKGVPTAVGATAVGLNAIAGVVMHVVLTLCALLLASGDGRSVGLSVPGRGVIALGVAAVSMTAVVGAAIPSTRRLVVTRVLPQVRIGWDALKVIVRDPLRLLTLFGGAAMITLFYLAAMAASLRAFGSTASLPMVALLFLTGSAVASAAPTPGGLGATEAALVAALSTIEHTAIVVPAVFLYRLVTFWLPILPGWLALTHLRRTGSL